MYTVTPIFKVASELFNMIVGIKTVPVHYRGGAPALTDVIGGHTQVLFISVTLMNQP